MTFTFKENPPKRVLIINIFGIGDVLFTTPVISNLKASYPDLYIGYVCNSRTAAILQSNPKIDKVIIYDSDDFKEASQKSKMIVFRKLGGFLREIKKERFDTSIDVSLSDFTGWVTWMAGIKRRVGFKYKSRGFFLNQKLMLKGYEDKHVVEYYLNLLESVGIKNLHEFARDLLKISMVNSRLLSSISPALHEIWDKWKNAFHNVRI
ncbi:MAG: glycosyltransferase family 9 protein [Candidatus Marinimicrobia bacterium]|nr:glycosyltransferase family 9 protein [Candidatus Neomarinimicrobiota bacterium]